LFLVVNIIDDIDLFYLTQRSTLVACRSALPLRSAKNRWEARNRSFLESLPADNDKYPRIITAAGDNFGRMSKVVVMYRLVVCD